MTEGCDVMTEFLTRKPLELPFIMYPRFLLETELNETAKLVYMLLLDRARLSQKNNWADEYQKVFIRYTISELARHTHKSRTTIKEALNALEAADLIMRKHQGQGMPNHIYVKIPFQPPEQ